MNLLDQVKQHRRVIKHESITFSIAELVGMYEAEPKEIKLAPEFQRLFRWSRDQQSNFIESLILEIPIPALFFYENEDGVWELLDGLQRLSTIIRFFNQVEIPDGSKGRDGNDSDWHYENEHKLEAPLQLLPGEYLSELEGMTMGTLPIQLQLNLKRARLQVTILKRETDPIYKYAVFERLNRGGSLIEPQEIRNCSIRILDKDYPDFIQKLGKHEPFVEAVKLSESDMRNGYIDELVLRFFATKNYHSYFKHDVQDFLTRYMEGVARNSIAFNYEQEEQLFQRFSSLIRSAMGPGEAFRAKKSDFTSQGPFSPAIYEMVTYGVVANIDKLESLNGPDIGNRICQLIIDAKAANLTGSGSNSKKKFQDRLQLAKSRLA